MHKETIELMKNFVDQHLDPNKKLNILDVGSYSINGSFRHLFDNVNWTYTGLDMVAGPNVDIVSKSAYDFGLNETYDVVISGNCLEHVEAPWLWIKEVEKAIVENGLVCIVTPFSIGEHKYPVDCWRILPDGYKYLLEVVSEFKVIDSKINIQEPQINYRFFDSKSSLRWILKILPLKIKSILEYKTYGVDKRPFPTNDTYVIAIKK